MRPDPERVAALTQQYRASLQDLQALRQEYMDAVADIDQTLGQHAPAKQRRRGELRELVMMALQALGGEKPVTPDMVHSKLLEMEHAEVPATPRLLLATMLGMYASGQLEVRSRSRNGPYRFVLVDTAPPVVDAEEVQVVAETPVSVPEPVAVVAQEPEIVPEPPRPWPPPPAAEVVYPGGMGDAVRAAILHMRQHYSFVTTVFYSRSGDWMFVGDDMKVAEVTHNTQLNWKLLTEAAESVPSKPVAYRLALNPLRDT